MYIHVCVCICYLVAKSCPTLCDPMDCSLPGTSIHRFPKQEYWNGLPFPSPGGLPDPGIKPMSPALVGKFSTTEPPGKPIHVCMYIYMCVCVYIYVCVYIDIILWEWFMFVFILLYTFYWASQVVLVVKNPPASAGDVRDMGLIPGSGESHLAWQPTAVLLPSKSCRQEPGGLQSMGSKRIRHNWSNVACIHIHFTIYLKCVWMCIHTYLKSR